MDFVAWLDANVLPENKYPRARSTAQTIFLREKDRNVDMTLEINKVLNPAFIMRPDELDRWGIFEDVLKDGGDPERQRRRCDFLMIGESDGKRFAFFMEFKKTVPDSNDIGNVQLRWSLPLLNLLLSVFNVESKGDSSVVSGPAMSEKDFTIRYFQIGQQWNDRLDRQTSRFDRSRLNIVEEYMGINVNYCIRSVVSPKRLLQISK